MQSATAHSTRPAPSRTPTVHLARILCPTDASEVSRHAREYAIALARWYGGEITGLTVLPGVPPAAALPEFAPSLVMAEGAAGGGMERAREALRGFLAPVGKAGIVTHALVEEGNPADHILAAAERMPADLIVMGTHGLRGFERWLLGSVTERVLRRATCPVLTVPRQAIARAPEAQVLLERLLCPVDFSPASMRALDYALSLAREAHAHLTVLYVLENVFGPISAGDVTFDAAAYMRFMMEDATARLRAAISTDARSWCDIQEKVVAGDAYREILRVAKEDDTHMIVMGVHGRNAIDLMFFGSTTNHVVRDAACPVLSLRT